MNLEKISLTLTNNYFFIIKIVVEQLKKHTYIANKFFRYNT